MKQLKVRLFRELLHRLERIVIPAKAAGEVHNLTEQSEVGLVRNQPKHNKVGILPIHAVAGVGLISGLVAHLTDVLHDLVLAFTGDLLTREDHLQVPPEGILLDFFADKVLDGGGNAPHELCPRRDAVRVEGAPRRGATVAVGRLDGFALGGLGQLHGAAEAPRSLLVKFGARSDAIDGHVHRHLGLDNLRDDPIDVMHNAEHHIPLAEDVGDVEVVRVGTSVDDTIHVQIKVIKLRKECRVRNDMVDLGIAFTNPSVELNTTKYVERPNCWHVS